MCVLLMCVRAVFALMTTIQALMPPQIMPPTEISGGLSLEDHHAGLIQRRNNQPQE